MGKSCGQLVPSEWTLGSNEGAEFDGRLNPLAVSLLLSTIMNKASSSAIVAIELVQDSQDRNVS